MNIAINDTTDVCTTEGGHVMIVQGNHEERERPFSDMVDRVFIPKEKIPALIQALQAIA